MLRWAGPQGAENSGSRYGGSRVALKRQDFILQVVKEPRGPWERVTNAHPS